MMMMMRQIEAGKCTPRDLENETRFYLRRCIKFYARGKRRVLQGNRRSHLVCVPVAIVRPTDRRLIEEQTVTGRADQSIQPASPSFQPSIHPTT